MVIFHILVQSTIRTSKFRSFRIPHFMFYSQTIICALKTWLFGEMKQLPSKLIKERLDLLFHRPLSNIYKETLINGFQHTVRLQAPTICSFTLSLFYFAADYVCMFNVKECMIFLTSFTDTEPLALLWLVTCLCCDWSPVSAVIGHLANRE